MKRKISFLISALCALGACASFTACMTESQNGSDDNVEKAKTNIVEQQNNDDGGCPDGNCREDKSEAPDAEDMPPMPEFRFMPHPEHMPSPANNDESKVAEDGNDNNDNDDNGEAPEEGKKPPMPAPHRGGKIKPKMPKKGK